MIEKLKKLKQFRELEQKAKIEKDSQIEKLPVVVELNFFEGLGLL